MKKRHAFRPEFSEPLEDRVVLSTAANQVHTAFQQFEKQLLTQAKTFNQTRLVKAVGEDVNGLGRYVSHILGNTQHAKQLVRQYITGAPNPHGTDFTGGAARGSLRAALLGQGNKVVAITNAENNILRRI